MNLTQRRRGAEKGTRFRASAPLRLCVRLFLVTGVSFAVLTGSLEAAVLRFRPAVQVSGGVVRVGDVAEVTDADEAELDKLKAITLVPAPSAGRSVRVDYEVVRSRLTAQGVNMAEIEFAGKSVVLVTGTAAVEKPVESKIQRVAYTSDSVADAAQRRLSNAVCDYLARADERLAKAIITAKLTDEQIAVLARPLVKIEIGGGSAPWTGEQLFAIRVRDPRKSERSMTVRCHVAPLSQVVHAARTIRAGQIVTAEDIVLQATVEESSGVRTLVDRVSLAVGMQAARNIRAGAPVAKEDLKKAVLVQRSQPVTILSRVGPVTVSMVGKADEDAAMGEPVSVTTLDRKRTLTAWVTGYHEVSVTEPKSSGGD